MHVAKKARCVRLVVPMLAVAAASIGAGCGDDDAPVRYGIDSGVRRDSGPATAFDSAPPAAADGSSTSGDALPARSDATAPPPTGTDAGSATACSDRDTCPEGAVCCPYTLTCVPTTCRDCCRPTWDAGSFDGCEATGCAMGQECCPATHVCYDSRCDRCCPSWVRPTQERAAGRAARSPARAECFAASAFLIATRASAATAAARARSRDRAGSRVASGVAMLWDRGWATCDLGR